MKYTVYKITNTLNGKMYFGATKQSLSKRWQQHKCNSTRKKYFLYLEMCKYGIENFKIESVFECFDENLLYEKEIELIKKYNTTDRLFGYNVSIGGKYSALGRKLTDKQKNKISNFQKGRKRKPHSEETKRKLSEIAKGRDMTIAIKKSAEKRRGKPSNNVVSVILNNELIFSSMTEAYIKTGVSVTSIHNNIKGISKTTKIGVWKIYK